MYFEVIIGQLFQSIAKGIPQMKISKILFFLILFRFRNINWPEKWLFKKKLDIQIKILITELKNPNRVPSPEKMFLFRITPFIEISAAFV